MASLKDMRVRIAATKATQKITKAMQMVAASKLRRAQVAAEAARPYAERMDKVLGNIASAVTDVSSAPKLLAGTGANQVHLLLVCTLFFSRFRSVVAQIPTAQQIIPAVFPSSHPSPASGEGQGRGNGASAAYEYEPEEEDILTELLPQNLAVQIFRALLENNASFYGAQMSAMDNATRNAGEMIRKQTLTYNRTRQAMITKELIEIISGAEAL